jgi:RNase P subunit RPR2
MPRLRNRSRTNKNQRKENAFSTQEQLLQVLENTKDKKSKLAYSASSQLISVSKKHRLSIPNRAKLMLCRKCYKPFSHGHNVRTRIISGMKVVTCLMCNNVRRYRLKKQ